MDERWGMSSLGCMIEVETVLRGGTCMMMMFLGMTITVSDMVIRTRLLS